MLPPIWSPYQPHTTASRDAIGMEKRKRDVKYHSNEVAGPRCSSSGVNTGDRFDEKAEVTWTLPIRPAGDLA
jgi:hypothetical protein